VDCITGILHAKVFLCVIGVFSRLFVTLFDRLAVVSWGNFQFPRKILQLQITMLKQIGGFFHIIKKSPNHKSGNWSQLGKECTYTNIPPNDFEKRAEIIG
jgi:hypothetical protein